MSIYKQSIQAFTELYESGLISEPEFNEFYQQTRHLQEDDEISEAIETWLRVESRSQILEAYKQRLQAIMSASASDSDQILGFAGSKLDTPPNQPLLSGREMLDNAIQRKSSDSRSSSTKSS